MPERIQRKRVKGWRMPPNTVSVTRPGRWGNPFVIGIPRRTGVKGTYEYEPTPDAATAVRFFCEMLARPGRNFPSDAEIKTELRGKNLACFCRLDQPCHADVLLELANKG